MRARHSNTPHQTIGDAAEARARAYLEAQGLSFVASNALAQSIGGKALGELDLVMREGETWVFVEVRSRKSKRFGGAAASITPAKLARMQAAAQVFLKTQLKLKSLSHMPPCRLDIITIDDGELGWIKNASQA